MARKDFSHLKIETLNEKDSYFNHEAYIAGVPPFLRGVNSTMFVQNSWKTYIEVPIDSEKDISSLLSNYTEKGYNSFYLKFSEATFLTNDFIEKLFKNTTPNLIEILIDEAVLSIETITFIQKFTSKLTIIQNTSISEEKRALTDLNVGHQLIFTSNESDAVKELIDLLNFSKNSIDFNLKNGLLIDTIAPKISFNLNLSGFIFENIAKLRASRLIWAMFIKQYSPKNTSSMALNLHSFPLEEQEVLEAIFGGCQTITSNEQTQLFFKEETYSTKTVDPWAGSCFVEKRTEEIATQVWSIFSE